MSAFRRRLEQAVGRRVTRLPLPLLRAIGRSEPQPDIDPRVFAVLRFFDRVRKRKLHELPPRRARAEFQNMVAVLDAAPPAVGAIENTTVAGRDARVYRPTTSGPWPVLVYFHGGGGCIGSIETHDVPARFICEAADCVVLMVDYRLAPEHPFPSGLEDALATFDWARDNAQWLGGDGRIGVGGDSHGGNLSAVVSQARRGEDGPDAQLLIYPSADATLRGESRRSFAEGYLLTEHTIRWFRKNYSGGADLADPRISPGLAKDARGVAPALLITTGFDPLQDEGTAYADKLARAGVRVVHRCVPDQVHGFIHMTGISARATAALTEAAHGFRDLLR